MRVTYLLATTFLVANGLMPSSAQGQAATVAVASKAQAEAELRAISPSPPITAASVPGITLRGRVVSPTGVLPGAVVRVQSCLQSVVTNANGEFQIIVPSLTVPL